MLSPKCSWVPLKGSLALVALMLSVTGVARAQESPATLTLEDAIRLARQNNPEFLTQKNDEAEADWAVRAAYGALLPSASVSTGMQYQAPGEPRFGVFTGGDLGVSQTSGYLLSSYSIGLRYHLGGETLLRPRQEQANREATHARIEAAAFQLTADITRQYLAAVAASDGVALAQKELDRASENLKLAEARVAVGSAIALESKQAEVERGRAEVELLKAENLLHTETLRLMERVGVDLDQEVELTSTFEVFDPPWSADTLVNLALERHPQLQTYRAQDAAARTGVRMAKSQYLPTVDVSAGWSGFTREATNSDLLLDQYRNSIETQVQNCIFTNDIASRLTPPLPTEDCSTITADPAVESQILAENNVFPFSFTREPFSASLNISLPIFNGFSREHSLETARVAADDARLRLRAEELRLKTDVAAAYNNLRTANRAVTLESRNRELAEEQLELARERYRVGAVSFVDLVDAETRMSRADRAYLQAVYAFHEGLAALESAVGIDLRATLGGENR